MLHSAVRWLIPILAFVVLGPVAGWLTASLRAPDGAPDATLLLSVSPMRGVLAGLGVFALALVAGAAAARMMSTRWGLFCAGLVLVWAAWGTGRVDHILGRTQSGSTLYTLSIEGLLVGALGIALAFILLRIPTIKRAAPLTELHQHFHVPPPPDEPRGFDDKALPVAVLAAAAAGGVAVFLIAQDSLKGQTFAAAAIGAVFAAAAGRVVSQRLSCVAFFGAFAVLMAASPAAATLVHSGSSGVLKAALANNLFRLARPVPLDWIAGAFIGIPIGLTWAGSMIEKHHPAEAR